MNDLEICSAGLKDVAAFDSAVEQPSPVRGHGAEPVIHTFTAR